MQQTKYHQKMTHRCDNAGDNTGAGMTDWVLIRWRLLDLRLCHEPNKSEFSRQSGIHRGTIDRIEDVPSDPEYGPDLDTIQKWVETCGSALPKFFSEIEHGVTFADTALGDNDPAIVITGASPHHGSSAFSSPDAADLTDLRETLAIFASALASAVDALRSGLGLHADSDRSVATVDVTPTESRSIPHDVRG